MEQCMFILTSGVFANKTMLTSAFIQVVGIQLSMPLLKVCFLFSITTRTTTATIRAMITSSASANKTASAATEASDPPLDVWAPDWAVDRDSTQHKKHIHFATLSTSGKVSNSPSDSPGSLVKSAMMIGVKLPEVGPGLYKRGKCSIRLSSEPFSNNRKPSKSPAWMSICSITVKLNERTSPSFRLRGSSSLAPGTLCRWPFSEMNVYPPLNLQREGRGYAIITFLCYS